MIESEAQIITGNTIYKGILTSQHKNTFDVFKNFLSEIQPSRILEIGTFNGGFTLFLRNTLDNLNLKNSKIITYDIQEHNTYNYLRSKNIEINIENLFDESYTYLQFPDKIASFIQSDGITLVLCDGGNKVSEFNLISPLIKNGDFIMAHDYVDTSNNFIENFQNKIWNWWEISEDQISEISEKQNLKDYKKEIFNPVVWVCKQKWR